MKSMQLFVDTVKAIDCNELAVDSNLYITIKYTQF